jgi:hypothetical protein
MKQARLNQSGLLFVPRGMQRARTVQWLKRIHAWTGFWGALLFLMLGISGVLLNHRSILKIDTGEPVEVSAIDMPVRAGEIPDEDGLATWAKRALDLPVEGKPPRGGGGGGGGGGGSGAGGGREGGRAPAPATFLGRERPQADKWTRVFTMPDAKVTVEHVPGSPYVSARTEAVGALGFLKNMHKGVGIGVLWVLFIDTIAGALVAMSLTGFLLWSRLHGSRLVAGGIALASLALALSGSLPFLF